MQDPTIYMRELFFNTGSYNIQENYLLMQDPTIYNRHTLSWILQGVEKILRQPEFELKIRPLKP